VECAPLGQPCRAEARFGSVKFSSASMRAVDPSLRAVRRRLRKRTRVRTSSRKPQWPIFCWAS